MLRLSSILATNTLTLVFLLGVNFTQIASLTGYFLLGVGCSAWLFSATARVYGKRHTYVIGSLLLVGGSIWGAAGIYFDIFPLTL
jgi:type IV secretory pathway TrbL component